MVTVKLPACVGIVLADPAAQIAGDTDLKARSLEGRLHYHQNRIVSSSPTVRVFVDEAPSVPVPPAEEWDAEQCWLFVPSGRLEVQAAEEFAAARPSSGAAAVDLRPGDYRLDLWENDSEIVVVLRGERS